MNLQKLFIVNLKDYRKKLHISQAELAEKCNSSQTYIAEIEAGKKFPSPDMIERIACALDIESHYLFRDDASEVSSRYLSPSQRVEIIEKIYSAVIKIINQY